MGNRLFFLSNGAATEMSEQPYDSEASLQTIIANEPQLLMREWEDKPRRIFLVQRELIIMESAESSNSYSLDHLFIGDDAVPIFVEVKRSSDTRIRREVVAQMLDYACRASSLDVGSLRNAFVENNDMDDCAEFDTDEFWEQVATNLRAERLRLVFVADKIPDTLRVLIEFLDRSMGDLEIYGVEIRRYKTGDVTLLSTNIVGNSLYDARKISSSMHSQARVWSKSEFLEMLRQRSLEGITNLIEALMDYATEKLGLYWISGTGAQFPAFHAKWNSKKIFSIEAAQNKINGYCCTVSFDTWSLPLYFGESWTPDKLRAEILSFASVPWAKERHYIWGDTPDKKWLYIDLRAFNNEQSILEFKQVLLELVNTLRNNTESSEQ